MKPTQTFWKKLLSHLNLSSCRDQEEIEVFPVHGGDINDAFGVTLRNGQKIFVKINKAVHKNCFQCERYNLKKLAPFCPIFLDTGEIEGLAYLALAYINITPEGDEARLGRLIAQLHENTNKNTGFYGWEENNYIGLSQQANAPNQSWKDFWCSQRLMPQLELAYAKGFRQALKPKEAKLIYATMSILSQHTPRAALLHGDLWSGNKGYTETGEPIIFDPASYYGDIETDIAMTELFGGFSPAFYREYEKVHPRAAGYNSRKRVYNLYHLLNHLNLFGPSYLAQCEKTIDNIIEM